MTVAAPDQEPPQGDDLAFLRDMLLVQDPAETTELPSSEEGEIPTPGLFDELEPVDPQAPAQGYAPWAPLPSYLPVPEEVLPAPTDEELGRQTELLLDLLPNYGRTEPPPPEEILTFTRSISRRRPPGSDKRSRRLEEKKTRPLALRGMTCDPLQTSDYVQGKNGLNPVKSIKHATRDLIGASRHQPVSDEIREYLQGHLSARDKLGGRTSYIRTERDPSQGIARTIGFYDAPRGNHRREGTPLAPYKVASDQNGHGFSQASVANPVEADKVEHMHAQSALNNLGISEAVESYGADLFEHDGSVIVKVLTALGTKRPKGFIDALYQLEDGEWKQLVSIVSSNPVLDKVDDTIYSLLVDIPVGDVISEYLSDPDPDVGTSS